MKFIWMCSILVLIISGCAQKKTIELEIVKIFESKNIQNNMCNGIYNDKIYSVRFLPDKFTVQFQNLNGDVVSQFDIQRGKGPGEMMHSLFARIIDDSIYIADFMLERINKYTLEGKFIESIEFSNQTGIIVSATIVGNYMYFHSLQNVFFGKMNLQTGVIEKMIPHKTTKTPEHGDLIEAVYVQYDPFAKVFYLGHMYMPYSIEVYDEGLNKLSVIDHKTDTKYTPMKWHIDSNRMDPIGSMLITSMAVDNTYIYAPNHASQTDFRNGKWYLDPVDGGVNVFDKKGNFLYCMKNKKFEGTEGEFNIVGVTNDSLVIEVVDNNYVVKNLLNEPDRPVGVTSRIFVVCKKPAIMQKTIAER